MKGIVFEGGGASAYCHIGVVKYLEEIGREYNYIAGSSSGALIAVFYGAGFTARQMEDICRGIKFPVPRIWSALYNLYRGYGILSTDFIVDIVRKHIGDITIAQYEALYGRQLLITACKNFKVQYFDASSPDKLPDIVARSCAFPFVFAMRDGYNDGGIVANFPYAKLQDIFFAKYGEKSEEKITGIFIKRRGEFAEKKAALYLSMPLIYLTQLQRPTHMKPIPRPN